MITSKKSTWGLSKREIKLLITDSNLIEDLPNVCWASVCQLAMTFLIAHPGGAWYPVQSI